MLLHRDLLIAVPSALGYTIAARARPGAAFVEVTVADQVLEPRSVRARLDLVLGPGEPGRTASATFYARSSHAFDRLAAELGTLLDRNASVLVGLDLPTAPIAPRIVGLADFSTVNRAVGVLIGRGFGLDEARAHLEAQSRARRTSLAAVAHDLLRS